MTPSPPASTLFPYTTLFRSLGADGSPDEHGGRGARGGRGRVVPRTVPVRRLRERALAGARGGAQPRGAEEPQGAAARSEEHTSELQSPCNLVCRLLLEKKKA